MNVAGHIAIAVRLHPDDVSLWLGAALPDLAAMGRFRLMGETSDAAVASGIALHHRTDEAFHRHRHFTMPMARLRTALTDDGLGRGATRAVAHVGPELLIDGELLDRASLPEAVEAAFDTIVGSLDALEGLVVEEQRENWRRHLAQVRSWGLPQDYADAGAVANRLHRILARRPRLAFDSDQIATIGRRLGEEQPGIVARVDELMGEMTSELAAR